ncbi:MAG: STAS domain-containing protein [Saprospiraceae bacterium]|jgi:anti-anti-sigma factor|nr:STAS domain-containing protein [Saprospiraceae bacterium]MBL0294995.1 STAS domain-containing protein [Saprospiraceae bacterium]
MKYTIDKNEKYTLFSLNEDNLNSLLAPNLKSEMIILANEGVRNIILDLSNVKYVDSSGLSAILTGNRLFKEEGSFVLTGIVSPHVKKLIEISKLDTILVIVPSIQESIDYVFMEELEREMEEE